MANSPFDELLEEFLLEARERADEIEEALLEIENAEGEKRQDLLAQAKRQLHTLKGNSGMMGFTALQELAHDLEDRVETLDLESPEIDPVLEGVDRMRRELAVISGSEEPGEAAQDTAKESAAEAPETRFGDLRGGSVRLPFSKIDQLVEMLAEIVIFRNRLSDAISQGLALARSPGAETDFDELVARQLDAWEDVERSHQALEKTLKLFQEQVTHLGMVPLQTLFRSLGRIVHDESEREGKQVRLDIVGGDTPIDKTLLEIAAEALGHLVRNSVIHGIENPESRRQSGKSQTGTVRVGASIEGSQVIIEVDDDGRGIDLEGLAERARERGFEGKPSPAALFELIFEEGVSTHVGTDLSAGRGVGLSAVKKSVERHGGRVEVASEPGRGSTFRLRLPVTASILRSLLLEVDGERYALPLASVAETLNLDAAELHEVNRSAVLPWRKELVPLLDLGLTFATSETPRRDGYVVLIDVNGRLRGLAVDDLVGIRDIVVKGLDTIVGQPTGISGSTILGDGRVIMILDPAALSSVAPHSIDSR